MRIETLIILATLAPGVWAGGSRSLSQLEAAAQSGVSAPARWSDGSPAKPSLAVDGSAAAALPAAKPAPKAKAPEAKPVPAPAPRGRNPMVDAWTWGTLGGLGIFALCLGVGAIFGPAGLIAGGIVGLILGPIGGTLIGLNVWAAW